MSTKRVRAPKPKDPTGDVAWLASKLIERGIQMSNNQMAQALHKEFALDIEQVLKRNIGPRSKGARKIKQYVRAARAAMLARGAAV